MKMPVLEYNIGCEPSPSVPAETVLQDGWKTYLLFYAVSKSKDADGYLDDLGVAVLECKDCVSAKFGYPNDEGLSEHPLYNDGISDSTTSILEVVESSWISEVDGQRINSANRIWGNRGIKPDWIKDSASKHFIVLLKEKTFECLATDLVVERFCESFEEAFAYVTSEFMKH